MVNIVLMGMCTVFKNIQNNLDHEPEEEINDNNIKEIKDETKNHSCNLINFMREHNELCIYDIGVVNKAIEI